MGNTPSSVVSSPSSSSCSSCNSCSYGGKYFSFGSSTSNKRMYKNHVVKTDVYGKRYITISGRKYYLPKGTRTTKSSPTRRKSSPTRRKSSPTRRKSSPTRRKSSPTRRKSSPKKRKPIGYYKDKKVKSPRRKQVKDKKGKKIGRRLSARALYNEGARIGSTYNILQSDGSYKVKYLRLRKNGSPYFANNFGKELPIHLNLPHNKNWLRGSAYDDMTGLKSSWPNANKLIAPGGVAQPLMYPSLLPRMKNKNVKPHMHYGKMCFGAG
jgi:hypothetical protein